MFRHAVYLDQSKKRTAMDQVRDGPEIPGCQSDRSQGSEALREYEQLLQQQWW
jgi:hypothetical protein